MDDSKNRKYLVPFVLVTSLFFKSMLKRLFSLLKIPLRIRNNAKYSITDAYDKCMVNTCTGNITETDDNIIINRELLVPWKEEDVREYGKLK